MAHLREKLVQIQRRNYRKNLQLVRESLGPAPGNRIYEREYLRYVQDYQEISDKTELIKRVLASDLVFHGDYHTLRQSQRSVLRIMREIRGKREVTLCLEMFHGNDQKHLDSFLNGQSPENAFLKKINYAKKWPFHWDYWRPLLDFCREHQIPILGINTQIENDEGIKSLRARDQYAARVITKALIRDPGRMFYVVDGDYHVSPNHLPQDVTHLLTLLDISVRTLIIFQNAEPIYWKLCRTGKEEADVVKINDQIYCVMNTMPANKIQSYLNWLEYTEEAYYPVHRDWEDDALDGQGLTIPGMVRMITSLLGLDFPEKALDRLTICYPGNLRLMEYLHSLPDLQGTRRTINEKIKRDEGFLLEYQESGEDAYLIYLTNSNINMAAEEAAHFLNAVLRGRLTRRLLSFDRFYRDVITEALGFFGSKLINEKRKSQTENAIRLYLGRQKSGSGPKKDNELLQAAHYVLQHFYLQRKAAAPAEFRTKFASVYANRSAVPRIFSMQLGYMLGNKLYYAVKRGKFPLAKIRDYFRDPFDEPQTAFACYLEINDRLKQMKTVEQY